MDGKPKFPDSCYRWVDHVPMIEADSLGPDDLRAHLDSISRWIAEVVTFGFDTAGVPPSRLNLSAQEAFALVKEEIRTLTGTETYVFDFNEVPDEQWNKAGIWAYMKPRLGWRAEHAEKNLDWFRTVIEPQIATYEKDGYSATAGRATSQDYEGGNLQKSRAQRARLHRHIHEVSSNYWSMISITTKDRQSASAEFADIKEQSRRIAREFYENAADAALLVNDPWRCLCVLAHEIGHERLDATCGYSLASRIDAEIKAESYGNLLSLWLTPDRSVLPNARTNIFWQTAPKARDSQHRFVQAVAEIACGATLSSAQSVHDNIVPLEKAMGWHDLPGDTIVGSDDIFKASEKLATAVAEGSLPNGYAERQAALCLAQLWHVRPDMIERGSETLNAACVWGDSYWTALSRRGEARMRAVLDDARMLARPKIARSGSGFSFSRRCAGGLTS